MCEKPLTSTLDSTNECYELAEKQGRPLLCAFNRYCLVLFFFFVFFFCFFFFSFVSLSRFFSSCETGQTW